MPMLPGPLTSSPCWWVSHLSETACRSGNDSYSYVHEAFGVSAREADDYYKRTLNLADPFGEWPAFSMWHGAHALSVRYFGAERHEVRYEHTEGFRTTTWAVDSGYCMLPGFRWEELLAFSRLTADPSVVLLLLLPVADIPAGSVDQARDVITGAFGTLGYRSAGIDRFTDDLVEGLRSEGNWWEDDEFGWITDNVQCWRCRGRPAAGLLIPDGDAFRSLKRFTDHIAAG